LGSERILKFLVTLSTVAILVSSPVLAQDHNADFATETAEIVPLFKMAKPELKIVYTKKPKTTTEDVVIATGTKISKPDIKVNNPVICREEIVPDFGEASNGSRLRKTQKYCNHRSKWDSKERAAQKLVKDITGM